MGLDIELKPIKGFTEWVHKQFNAHYIWYRRKGYYAECHCSECGEKYFLRTETTGDPFQDDAIDIEKPKRDKATKCRKCGIKALYKPVGRTKSEWHYQDILTGQKISDEKFVFRITISNQKVLAGCRTNYHTEDNMLIVCEKGKKPAFYSWTYYHGWVKGGTGIHTRYIVHPSTFREIKKTGMYKYVPTPLDVLHCLYWDECWVTDFYIAAARYPDFEMLIKVGMDAYWQRLMHKEPTNINPRGRSIEDRLRIRKDRIKDLVEVKGEYKKLCLYQLERRYGAKWTDEEIEIAEELRDMNYGDGWKVALKYTSPTRVKNYLKKQKLWPNKSDKWNKQHKKQEDRNIYYDYLHMKASEGYEMNDINLFPKDFVRRHDEIVLETEKKKLDARKQEVLKKFPKIKHKYKQLSDKYSAAAGGYIIRPAKDAAEIVMEGRILHHCVGGDNYLSKHNSGQTAILFLRKAKEKDMPYITVEIKGEEIIQWYGAYDKKPNKTLIKSWLKTYTKELEKRKDKKKNCTGATRRKTA